MPDHVQSMNGGSGKIEFAFDLCTQAPTSPNKKNATATGGGPRSPLPLKKATCNPVHASNGTIGVLLPGRTERRENGGEAPLTPEILRPSLLSPSPGTSLADTEVTSVGETGDTGSTTGTATGSYASSEYDADCGAPDGPGPPTGPGLGAPQIISKASQFTEKSLHDRIIGSTSGILGAGAVAGSCGTVPGGSEEGADKAIEEGLLSQGSVGAAPQEETPENEGPLVKGAEGTDSDDCWRIFSTGYPECRKSTRAGTHAY